MVNTIHRKWRAYLLRRRMEAMNGFYNQKISAALSKAEARKHHEEKVRAICTLAACYLNNIRISRCTTSNFNAQWLR